LTGLEDNSFSLLWRGSRDGFNAAEFHRLCDGQASTLTIIKNTEGFIFGGFTSIPWSSAGCRRYTDHEAFIFSLTNPSDILLKLKVIKPRNAVYHDYDYGPIFGAGRDLFVSDLSNTNRDSFMNFVSYESPEGKSGRAGGKFIVGGSNYYFQTVEIEVFEVF